MGKGFVTGMAGGGNSNNNNTNCEFPSHIPAPLEPDLVVFFFLYYLRFHFILFLLLLSCVML